MADVGHIREYDKNSIDDLYDMWEETKDEIHLEEMFFLFDRDNSGVLSRKEIKEMLITMNGVVRAA